MRTASLAREALHPVLLDGEEATDWWVCLGQAVDDLARRYPRTYGATIPASWRDDLETVELLASITRWRRELDDQHARHGSTGDIELMRFRVSGLERARQEWEWHAHRDLWLVRLAETGRTPRFAPAAPRSRLMATPRLLTPDEAGEILRCSGETIKRYVRSGELRAFRHRGSALSSPSAAIERFVEERMAEASLPQSTRSAELGGKRSCTEIPRRSLLQS